jgi:hypothetical protein
MTFENNIQQWVTIDNQLKQLNEKAKEIREKKHILEDKITSYVSNNNNPLNSNIKISDGRLKIANTKVMEPITFKYLEKTLNEIIKNESQVKLIMEHIKEKRSVKIVPEIKRFYNN